MKRINKYRDAIENFPRRSGSEVFAYNTIRGWIRAHVAEIYHEDLIKAMVNYTKWVNNTETHLDFVYSLYMFITKWWPNWVQDLSTPVLDNMLAGETIEIEWN